MDVLILLIDGSKDWFVYSVLNPMFGRGGVAGDATTTSWQGCRESTSKQLRRKLAMVRRQRLKSFESRLSGFVNKEEKQDRRSKVAWPEVK